MCLHVESIYEPNQLPTNCTICGRSTGGRFSPPVRHLLMDGDEELGDVCERCAYGSIDLWRVALNEYSVRLETQASFLRHLASRLDEAEPAPEGIVEDLIRENMKNQNNRRPGGLPPPRGPFS